VKPKDGYPDRRAATAWSRRLRLARPSSLVFAAVAAALACAAIQEPPGGPPDTTPPAIVAVSPDSGAVIPGWRDAAIIRFNEVVDERSGGSLDKLVTLSPAPRELIVEWKRTAIAVRPKDGWQQGVIYQMSLLPGIQDLRNNRSREGRTIVFSTGPAIPSTRLSGTVLDWEQGRLAPRALIEAILLPDSLRYLGVADSAGDFSLGALPPGRYLVRAGVDANNNRRLDLRESFDTALVKLDSTASRTFWAVRQDTVGPSLTRATIADSTSLRLEFNQALPPHPPEPGSVRVLALPDSLPVPVAQVWRLPDYDSARAIERAAAARSPARAADTAATRDTAARVERRDTVPAAPDTSRLARLLRERPRLSNVLVVELQEPMQPGSRYLILADLANLSGARARSRQLVVVPARAAPGRP
jgi:hypothetical protein